MKNHAYALAAGLFIIVLCAAGAGIVLWLGGGQGATKAYRILSHNSVSGLVKGSSVFYLGVPAGEVTNIHLAEHRARTVLIDIAVTKDTHITHSTYATLQIRGVTGQSEVELSYSGNNENPLPTSSEHPGLIPLKPSLLGGLAHSGKHMLAQIDALSTKLNRLVSKKNRTRIDRLLANAGAATGELTRLERHLDRAAVTLPQLSTRMQQTLVRVADLADHLNQATTSLNRLARHATKLSDTGRALGQAALSKSLPQLNQTLRNLQQTSMSIKTLSRNLNRDPQRLLFGPHASSPGPGEQGYQRPEH